MKEISWAKIFKRIGVLYGFFVLVFLGLFFFIRSYSKTKFSESAMEKTMTTVSKLRDMTGDPCLYSILGDPIDAGGMYGKVNIICPGGKHSNNSVDLRVLTEKSIIGLLREVGRVNGFKVSLNESLVELGDLANNVENNSWSCYVGTRKISDFNEVVIDSSSLDCYYGNLINNKKK